MTPEELIDEILERRKYVSSYPPNLFISEHTVNWMAEQEHRDPDEFANWLTQAGWTIVYDTREEVESEDRPSGASGDSSRAHVERQDPSG